jgi:hypothetical protein
MRNLFFTLLLGLLVFPTQGQVGLTATPVKFHYELAPGENGTQSIIVSNPTDREVEVGVSFSDWNYNEEGNNQFYDSGTLETSCVDWIKILPSSYFVLQPQERKKLEIVLSVPPNVDRKNSVHTAMLYFSQLNPDDSGVNKNGAAIKVTVRLGVKIYHSFYNAQPEMEITGFDTFDKEDGTKTVYLVIENQGEIWTDGKITWELFNKNTGKKQKLEDSEFYTLPGDQRRVEKLLPPDLEKGEYTLTAIAKYGESDVIKIAALDFPVK